VGPLLSPTLSQAEQGPAVDPLDGRAPTALAGCTSRRESAPGIADLVDLDPDHDHDHDHDHETAVHVSLAGLMEIADVFVINKADQPGAERPERRTDAARSLPSAQTLVCCALNYYQGPPAPIPRRGVISSYARGVDYHRVREKKLNVVADFIETTCNVPTKLYVDTDKYGFESDFAIVEAVGEG